MQPTLTEVRFIAEYRKLCKKYNTVIIEAYGGGLFVQEVGPIGHDVDWWLKDLNDDRQ